MGREHKKATNRYALRKIVITHNQTHSFVILCNCNNTRSRYLAIDRRKGSAGDQRNGRKDTFVM